MVRTPPKCEQYGYYDYFVWNRRRKYRSAHQKTSGAKGYYLRYKPNPYDAYISAKRYLRLKTCRRWDEWDRWWEWEEL